MNVINAFLKKDLKSLLRSKRLMLTFIFFAFFPVGLNYFATNSWVPLSLIPIIGVICVAMYSSEVLYWLSAEEMATGTFDILLVCPISNIKIAFYKLIFPLMVGFINAIVSMFLNDFLVVSLALNKPLVITIFNIIFAFLAVTVSCIMELNSLFIRRKTSIQFHTILLAIACIIMFLLLYINAKISWEISIVLGFGILILLVVMLINNVQRAKIERHLLLNTSSKLFPDRRLSRISVLIRRELLVIRNTNRFIIQFVLLPIIPFAMYLYIKSIPQLQIILPMSFVFASLFSLFNITFNTIQEDTRIKIYDTFSIAKIPKYILVLSKIIVPVILSSVQCLIAYLILTIAKCYYPLSISQLIFTNLIVLVLSISICIVVKKIIASYKNEHLIKSLLSVVVIILFCVIYLLI